MKIVSGNVDLTSRHYAMSAAYSMQTHSQYVKLKDYNASKSAQPRTVAKKENGKLDAFEWSEDGKALYEELQEQENTYSAQKADAVTDNGRGKTTELIQAKLTIYKAVIGILNSLYGGHNKWASDLLDMLEKKYGTTNSNMLSYDTGLLSQGQQMQYVSVTKQSDFFAEKEMMAFTGRGMAYTEDGRSIDFNVQFEVSRSFMQYSESMELEAIQLEDPLVINVGANVASISDQKFYFDLDGDGREEKISGLEKGSGFLALDKNDDGKINDGTELFGTKSGDGFRDLAKYDDDGNGWVDENDAVFAKLRVWYKGKNGEDVLLDLKSADVGAIFLGESATEFTQKTLDTNRVTGVIRSTGIYLKESGGAGTVQHLDLAYDKT